MSDAIVTLTEPNSRSQARVHLNLGCNCFEWMVRDGEPTSVLWSHPDFEKGTERPSGSGVPILFPFPGRLRGTQFRWKGTSHALPVTDGRGNAIHGLVLHRRWRLVERADEWMAAEFHLGRDAPDLRGAWPADFVLRVQLEIHPAALTYRLQATNADSHANLPFGLGLHPYFRIPRLADSHGRPVRVHVPVELEWELEDLMPTGRVARTPRAASLAQGLELREPALDNVFSIDATLQAWQASLALPEPGYHLSLENDPQFRLCVVYTPPHGEAICIEPYSCAPNAAELPSTQAPAGWRELEPGASAEFHFTVRLRRGTSP